MRVCVFIDGKNFHAGFKGSTSPGTRIDFPAMAAWLVERAGGSTLWGAHYYTGVERGGAARTEAQVGWTSSCACWSASPASSSIDFHARRNTMSARSAAPQ